MAGVPDSVTHCCNEINNMSEFSLLSADFGYSAFTDEYDPWTFVDTFGRARFYKSLLSFYKTVVDGPRVSASRSGAPMTTGVSVPGRSKRTRSASSGCGSASLSIVILSAPATSED